jgi:hypothetical protein
VESATRSAPRTAIGSAGSGFREGVASPIKGAPLEIFDDLHVKSCILTHFWMLIVYFTVAKLNVALIRRPTRFLHSLRWHTVQLSG